MNKTKEKNGKVIMQPQQKCDPFICVMSFHGSLIDIGTFYTLRAFLRHQYRMIRSPDEQDMTLGSDGEMKDKFLA